MTEFHFAEQTPYETEFQPDLGDAVRVLPEQVATLLRRELIGVVESGTARRAFGSIRLACGDQVTIGGKTGTGDNRFETYTAGGQVIESRVINRTATFVFFIDDRFYGVVTAFVPGEQAAGYSFTSSLPVQIFKDLAPTLQELLEAPSGG